MANTVAKLGLTAVVLALTSTVSVPLSLAAPNRGERSPFKHVFVIVLENQSFNTTFGPNSKAPFLSQTLTAEGVLLSQYYGTGHASLDNYICDD